MLILLFFKENCLAGCPCDTFTCDIDSTTTTQVETTVPSVTSSSTTTSPMKEKAVLLISNIHSRGQPPVVANFNGQSKLYEISISEN